MDAKGKIPCVLLLTDGGKCDMLKCRRMTSGNLLFSVYVISHSPLRSEAFPFFHKFSVDILYQLY